VTRKITRAVARISRGKQDALYLGNLEARRDWGYAPDFVVAMWQMLQQPSPDDFVIATGTDMSVRDFVQLAFDHVGLDWEKHVRFDPRYTRPTEVDSLIGDPSKATKSFGWQASVTPQDLVGIMVDHDLAAIDKHVVDQPVGKLWTKFAQ
jgi:GDPmannose 4,6-dehydratase